LLIGEGRVEIGLGQQAFFEEQRAEMRPVGQGCLRTRPGSGRERFVAPCPVIGSSPADL
jgi:hypothetical protein